MSTETVEFKYTTGQTLTATMYPQGNDTPIHAAAACTEATNRKGLYTFTNTTGETGRHDVFVLSGTTPVLSFTVDLTGTATTVREINVADAVKIGGTTQTGRDIGSSVLLAASQHVIVDSGTVTTITNPVTVTGKPAVALDWSADVSNKPTIGTSTLTAQQVWEYATRTVTAGAGGATAQEVWEYSTRSLTDKSGFALAASQHVIVDSGTVTTITNPVAVTGKPAVALDWSADVSNKPTIGTSTLTAQQVWEIATRTVTGGGGGATAQEVWEYATRSLTDKSNFALAASQHVIVDSGTVTTITNPVAVTGKPAVALDWSADVSNKPTIGTSTLTAQQVWEYATRTVTGGNGQYTQQVTVKAGSTPIPNAVVSLYSGAQLVDRQTTDASGQATLHADAGAYTVRASRAGYTSYTTALSITADAVLADVLLSAITISASEPGHVTAYLIALDEESQALAGVTHWLRVINAPHDETGLSLDTTLRERVSGDGGLVEWIGIPYGARVQYKRANGRWFEDEAPSTGSTWALKDAVDEV